MAEKITAAADGTLNVPDEPIIPFIEGDGTGVDIWPAAKLVLDAAAAKHGKTIAWKEVLAGEKAFNETGDWLPDETVDAFREYLIGIKGPLTTPVGGGIRSLNVALRQILDLYVCLRPVRWFQGVPSPVKHPEKVDMVIFRENTEDIYAGLEVEEGTPEAKKLIELLQGRVRLGHPRGLRHRHQADLRDRLEAPASAPRSTTRSRKGRKSVTLVHKGNIMKFTEGAFRNWGYELVTRGVRRRGRRLGRLRRQARRQDPREGHHRRHHAAAGAHPARRVRRDRHDEPQRRLPVRRAGRAGRRHRHRARRQHQLRHRPRHLRGDPRHRAEVRRPGQGQPRLGAALRRDDVRAPRLAGRRRRHRRGPSRRPSPTRSSPTTSPA